MASGLFEVKVAGTSHGEGITTTISNVPAGLKLDLKFIDAALRLRRPGQAYTTPRQETDDFEIESGVDSGQMTTGQPIVIFIPNLNQHSKSYDKLHNVLRPGHGITMQLLKDPTVDQAGGGAASARLTAGFVAAGAIAQLGMNDLVKPPVEVVSFITKMGDISAQVSPAIEPEQVYRSKVRCPDAAASAKMEALLDGLIAEGDSVGAAVQTVVRNYPGAVAERPGNSLDGQLAEAIMTINAVKGVVIGDLDPHRARGSQYLDQIVDFEGTSLYTETNHGGGILGGMSMGGMPIVTNTLFKPTGSIKKPVRTVDLEHHKQTILLGEEARHDPCVAIRGVEVVKAMHRIVLYRALLSER